MEDVSSAELTSSNPGFAIRHIDVCWSGQNDSARALSRGFWRGREKRDLPVIRFLGY